MSAPPVRIHVVSHTHWDREWYHSAGRFRQRLVALVNELLDDPPPPGESFLLDGQAVVLEDYLEVHPERRGELSALLRSGALEAGPWFVLADELIPGAEALVRNLLAGRRSLRALRASSPPLLYCPDSFGHPAALPLLAAGFGVGTVVLWRGYGGACWPQGDAAWWRSADGSRVVLYHLPADGYETGSSLPVDETDAATRWADLRHVLVKRAAAGVALLTNGADHHARQRGRSEALAALARAAAPDVVKGSSLSAFVRDFHEAAQSVELPEVEGELRDSTGYTWSLQGTFATRAAQKRRNAHAERLLVRDAEPWAALARARGSGSRRALVDAAWGALLRCHPHDTLCGCSTDEVARAMDARLDDAIAQGDGIREDALLDLLGHDRAAARDRVEEWRPHVVVRNAAARPRSGVATLQLAHTVGNVAVGPASAYATVPQPGEAVVPVLPFVVQALTSAAEVELTESPLHYPRADLVWRTDALAWVPEVPGYGIASVLASAPGDKPAAAPPEPVHPVTCGSGARLDGKRWSWIGNGLLRVECAAERMHLAAGASCALEAMIYLEEQEDRGDLYTPSLRGAPVRWTASEPELLLEGSLRCTVAMQFTPPAGTSGNTPVEVRLSLDAGARFMRIGVRGRNEHGDRRLRIGIATGLRDAEVWADAAFGPVRRPRAAVAHPAAPAERLPPTAPLHRYVTLHGARMGCTLYSDGLAEYEATTDGELCVTLVRAVGELSRAGLPERPGHAGWPRHVPEAQSLGEFSASFALLLHEAERTPELVDTIERVADDVLLPLTGESLRSALRTFPPVAGAELRGTGLSMSAIRESDDGEWLVLRCINVAASPMEGSWHLGHDVREAVRSRLDETPGEALAVEGGRAIRFRAAAREVVTILVR